MAPEREHQLGNPGQPTNDRLWLIIVVALCAVMVFAVVLLGLGMMTKVEPNATYLTKPETLLTVFTTTIGFLGGLLVPSPISKQGS